MTPYEAKIYINTCRQEIKLVEAWQNSCNYKACLRMIKLLRKEIDRIQELIHNKELDDE